MASDGEALVGLWFDGQKYFADSLGKDCTESACLPVFGDARRWLDTYFDGGVPDFTPMLRLRGSPFRQAVCHVMLGIPYGTTMTYGEVAQIVASRMGLNSMSAQAVGCAIGHNSISLIVPCHRVVGSGGRLTGYAGGLERKKQLLQLEGALPTTLL